MLTPVDFMPKFDRRRQTNEEIAIHLMSVAKMFHGNKP